MRFDGRFQKSMHASLVTAIGRGAQRDDISQDASAACQPARSGDTDERAIGVSCDWVRHALEGVPMPASPIDSTWEFSIASLVEQQLPMALRRVPRLLDQLGAIRLSPAAMTVDSSEISWRDIAEVRTCSLPEWLTANSADGINAALGRLLPLYRLSKRPALWVADKVNDVVLSLFLLALEEHGEQLVPTEIVWNDRRGRRVVAPGVLSAAVLAIPRVADSVLTTARINGVPVLGGSTSAEHRANAEAIRGCAADLRSRVARLRAMDGSEELG